MAYSHFRNIEDFEDPRLVQIDSNLYGAAFFLMKLLPARFILEQAFERGELTAGSCICETSSGTFALALAMLTAQSGNGLIIVCDWAIDPKLQRRLLELGARLEIITDPQPQRGLQQARLDRLRLLLAENGSRFWPCQYDNPDNPLSYARVAAKLVERIGRVDCLVGTVGSGGSLCGTARYLRMLFPDLFVIGVDTMNSVLFGQPDASRLIRGLGGSMVPKSIDHTQVDEVHWLSAAETFRGTRDLHHRHALFMGPTSGAAFKVAAWWSGRHRDKNTVVLMPDEGHRYIDTAYDDDWLAANSPDWIDSRTECPATTTEPGSKFTSWTRFAWGRRARSEVVP
ncbi:pyridoxal-phosphate dependent enzyme [Neorhizobium galegae]|uniref:pyridoxal-phosphate dependent enzyme n=1 Tax=Neorhizobium galegae TaxID=399 RepID=UPI0021065793|nr:pyridoxal-phosphate dependent enzyme [Neorhizobium galegae]MCQ1775276.1 pyridoxal-phosphate dependent enzyme [Neorhizobium galegae]MCQ1799766.1 pyridoxal-phosphate dependent enzyme [Neorhizobium galegae]